MIVTPTKSCQEHAAAFARIDALDLTMVKMKLCLPVKKEGKGWTQNIADLAEGLYKQFLRLNLLYPTKSIVPTRLIDEMWHQHILDTRAYDADCQRIFGYKLHHFPYFGLRDEQDAQDLADSFSDTCALFMHHFGVNLPQASSQCRGGGSGNGGGCSRNLASKCGQQNGGGTGCSRK